MTMHGFLDTKLFKFEFTVKIAQNILYFHPSFDSIDLFSYNFLDIVDYKNVLERCITETSLFLSSNDRTFISLLLIYKDLFFY